MNRSLLAFAWVFTATGLSAQWCVPATAIPYAATMPGVTHVVCNTIDRTSTDIENYPYNSYVNTGLTTVLEQGATYPLSIGFTIDNTISPHMNLRVWVDLNHDGQLDDVGETLLSVDHLAGPVYTGQITIPPSAMTGPTRMRVTAKMCSHGGHTLPTPCDLPPDPFGYHGELEDYTVDIIDAVGIAELELTSGLQATSSDGVTAIRFGLKQAADVRIDILDATGRIVLSKRPGRSSQGEYALDLPGIAARGTYLARLYVNDRAYVVRFLR
ncbi:MAG: GEVED domain-containing protein [Flavobacteriales bacterium]